MLLIIYVKKIWRQTRSGAEIGQCGGLQPLLLREADSHNTFGESPVYETNWKLNSSYMRLVSEESGLGEVQQVDCI